MLTMRGLVVDEIVKSLEVPESAYEAAERRYKDLGEWLGDRDKARSAQFSPHVFAQGSFRLGTVTRPWKRDDYDLDLSCVLQERVTKFTHTQEQLKNLVGSDLERYRLDRGIREKLAPRHRCWRLYYQDQLQFHMDIVPAIPEAEEQQIVVLKEMTAAGTGEVLARHVAEHAVAITDDRHPQYRNVSLDWRTGNQEGYALWFESRLRQVREFLNLREKAGKVDDLPTFRWKTPLQRSVQILKRHRDMMFETNSDSKPISTIITTLAARSYEGEADVESAMSTIVANMGAYVNPTWPRVPNPVNHKEDFADKWPGNPTLEASFWKWLSQVKTDFGALGQSGDIRVLSDTALWKFGTTLEESRLRKNAGLLASAAAITSGAAHTRANGTIGQSGVKNPPHKFYG